MAATREAQRLTEAHRLAQARLGARSVAEMLTLWALLDVENLDATVERWLRATVPVIQSRRADSARLAANYVDQFKKLELGMSARTPVVLAETARPETIISSLTVTGPATIKSNMARGLVLDRAVGHARTKVAGAAMRHALNGGRETVSDTIEADRQALGYARATSGKACAFCAMLASRGPVFKGEDTAGFQPHDHCSCSVEPVYRRDAAWPAGSTAYKAQWDQATALARDEDIRPDVAFRRLIEGRA